MACGRASSARRCGIEHLVLSRNGTLPWFARALIARRARECSREAFEMFKVELEAAVRAGDADLGRLEEWLPAQYRLLEVKI